MASGTGSAGRMREAGIRLELSDETIAAAMMYFHRFYVAVSNGGGGRGTEQTPAKRSFKGEMVQMACLFLSAKASEQQRKARDIINVFYAIQSGTNEVRLTLTPAAAAPTD